MKPCFEVATKPSAPKDGYMSLTIVGSGASTAVPVIGHFGGDCACADAIANPHGPNRRNNVSLLLMLPYTEEERVVAQKEDEKAAHTPVSPASHANFASAARNTVDGVPVRCVLVDCGKTFRDAYFKVLVKHQVRMVDALFLTHDHADAISGIDDMRDLQPMEMIHGDWYIYNFIPTYVLQQTLDTLKERVGYVLRNSQEVGAAPATEEEHTALMARHIAGVKAVKGEKEWNNIGIRRSTALQLFTLPADRVAPFYVAAIGTRMPMYSIPVEHGKDYISLGYVFGKGTAFKSQGATAEQMGGKSCVVYISDITDISASSLRFLQDLVKIDVLIMDCLLNRGRRSPVHYCMDETLEFIATVKPRFAYGVGMYCDINYETDRVTFANGLRELIEQGKLKEGEVLGVDLAYDGLEIVLPQ